MTPRILDDLVVRGRPSIQDCADAALRLPDDAPHGSVVILHLCGQPTEVLVCLSDQ